MGRALDERPPFSFVREPLAGAQVDTILPQISTVRLGSSHD
jgi:hypothetical protein